MHEIHLFIEFSNQIDENETSNEKETQQSTTSQEHFTQTHGNDEKKQQQ